MKKISFEEMISHLVRKGAASIKIERARSTVGCIAKGDIIALEVTGQQGAVFIATVQDIFDDEPIICVDRVVRNSYGRCIDRYTIKRFFYVH